MAAEAERRFSETEEGALAVCEGWPRERERARWRLVRETEKGEARMGEGRVNTQVAGYLKAKGVGARRPEGSKRT